MVHFTLRACATLFCFDKTHFRIIYQFLLLQICSFMIDRQIDRDLWRNGKIGKKRRANFVSSRKFHTK